MAKARSFFADYATYLCLRVFVCLVQALPLSAGRRLATGLAWLVYHLDKRHRQVAQDNLRSAFPGRYSETEIDVLVRRGIPPLFPPPISVIPPPPFVPPHQPARPF